MITIAQARVRVGDGVVYRPHPQLPPEEGTIVRVSDRGTVFVLYRGDLTAKATRPEDLDWLGGGQDGSRV